MSTCLAACWQASDVVTVPLEVKESWLGNFWKQLLESEDGNSWFHQWCVYVNVLVQVAGLTMATP